MRVASILELHFRYIGPGDDRGSVSQLTSEVGGDTSIIGLYIGIG
jgi:hypothetical protein